MLLTALLDSPLVLAALIASLWFLVYGIGAFALRQYSRQDFVSADDYLLPKAGTAQSDRPRRARKTWQGQLPFFLTIVAFSLTLSADPVTREIFGGGGFVMLVALAALNMTSLLTARALVNPAAAEGRIRYTAVYVNRATGASTLSLAFFSGIVGILFGSLAFMAGSSFLLVMAIGNFRRARQASRSEHASPLEQP
jgi:hypothetical protein